ncbi:hypothetical protein A2767_03590 [Candidatus Roizmanbacteria bacterium RIFCSPHIGHO2_01_FULL_35_10]|uniref:Uncharacterized protein n=1 Tax=Candidatus Roizmanbacteria bacterium RIFCSPLOWO2_01_FULL_35_13 TaxID=1802055 RepID=A0A1F7IA42_9BACT|nr:MAG: hypothetical protein A2767_03590 [Candidatus Roizmanbacteria bacterium RIFCSPHIGHO2_01_FULL_35_10]OGK40210.1 MAG: hypothetical protein A3A74_06910 [Candidatus Roizmanbacteria bacterium RIFCSPLOWO2_01_FULL_35_13]
MNKSLPVIIVVILLLLGGGAFLAFKNKPAQPGAVNTNVGQGQTQDGNVFTSIKDALSKSLSLECTYKDEKGTESTTQIKGGAIHVVAKTLTNGKEINSQIIMKDRKMYSWDEETKKGFVFEIPDETLQTTPSSQTPTGENKGESFLAEIEKYKDACKPAVVSDSLFTPPTDVEFQDFSSVFQNIPTGTSGNGAAPSFDLEQLKKQYAPENQ